MPFILHSVPYLLCSYIIHGALSRHRGDLCWEFGSAPPRPRAALYGRTHGSAHLAETMGTARTVPHRTARALDGFLETCDLPFLVPGTPRRDFVSDAGRRARRRIQSGR
ncbi:hypothetical protein EVAR_63238_1 [Eumeta japonica]|uniref:Uncharacterized protein n=1 Tax=Eumeta variegata TaxID=151549 RepID=A0A4C1Z8S3_EUMVA|nr:hypothetical protein EVAR_63238_1 [Eumeta japonica]